MPRDQTPRELLRHYVTGAIERGEAVPIVEMKPPAPSIAVYRTELTPEGEQLVIPGCERDAPQAGRKQLDLF